MASGPFDRFSLEMSKTEALTQARSSPDLHDVPCVNQRITFSAVFLQRKCFFVSEQKKELFSGGECGLCQILRLLLLKF